MVLKIDVYDKYPTIPDLDIAQHKVYTICTALVPSKDLPLVPHFHVEPELINKEYVTFVNLTQSLLVFYSLRRAH